MNQAMHPSTISKKLTSVPELPFKKGQLNLSPALKEKHSIKSTDAKIEPMVLRSPPTGESIVRFALPIPLSKTKELISSHEMVRNITQNLKTLVTRLEKTFGNISEDKKKEQQNLKKKASDKTVGDDVKSFLLCCSEFTAQLEEAVKEERGALESLYKWFQQQVNQLEEIGKDQSNLEAEVQSDRKSILNIVQIARLARKFEDIEGRLRERKAAMLAKEEDKATVLESLKNYELIEKQIEEFLTSHSDIEFQTVSETESGTPSVTNRMNTMMKIFENQSTMLEKALSDQTEAEAKYKKMETNVQLLVMEKALLKGEIRRLREIQKAKATSKEVRPKKSGKSEKKKDR
ncbi:coiled-coil domain-containing protein 7 [Rattus rattus]|uniref:coiled-coil domain-containing protein 7 n=1 Tax=Rattus rattus TaxID=10117 RepID=UPI0013F36562|nr:coiled-coil domain-containing protein 7 [Rattus rattus]